MKQIIISLMLSISIFLVTPINNCIAHTNLQKSDFAIPDSKNVDYEMKDYTMNISPERAREMIRKSGPRPSFGERVSVWFENALIWISSIPDRIILMYARLFGDTELRDKTEKTLQEYRNVMNINREAIGL